MKSENEVFNEWLSLKGYDKTDPVEDTEYRKSMKGTLSFQYFLAAFRMKEVLQKMFSLN